MYSVFWNTALTKRFEAWHGTNDQNRNMARTLKVRSCDIEDGLTISNVFVTVCLSISKVCLIIASMVEPPIVFFFKPILFI